MNNDKDIFNTDITPYFTENQKIFDNCFVSSIENNSITIDSEGICNFYGYCVDQLTNYDEITFNCPVVMHIDGTLDLQNKNIHTNVQLIIDNSCGNILKNGDITTNTHNKYYDLIIKGNPLEMINVKIVSKLYAKVDCFIKNDIPLIFYGLELEESLKTEDFNHLYRTCRINENGITKLVLRNLSTST